MEDVLHVGLNISQVRNTCSPCENFFFNWFEIKLVEFGRREAGMVLAILEEFKTRGVTLGAYYWLTDTKVNGIVRSSRIYLIQNLSWLNLVDD